MSDRRIRHGMRALMERHHTGRLDRRTRRALARIQAGLTAQPLEHLHALAVGHMARWELILQGYEAFAIANPGEPLPKQALGVANLWRRTAELLAALEGQLDTDRDKLPSLESYLANHTAAPEAPATEENDT